MHEIVFHNFAFSRLGVSLYLHIHVGPHKCSVSIWSHVGPHNCDLFNSFDVVFTT